jgi:hypothetical protein
MMILFAVDPGVSGGYAWSYLPTQSPPSEPAQTLTFPDQPADIYVAKWDGEHEASRRLADLSLLYHIEILMEEVHSSPQGGPKSNFTFGVNKGCWMGIFASLQLPYRTVQPQQWQRGIPGLTGKRDNERKNALKAEAQRRYPNLKVTLATADALLLHDYLKQQVTK